MSVQIGCKLPWDRFPWSHNETCVSIHQYRFIIFNAPHFHIISQCFWYRAVGQKYFLKFITIWFQHKPGDTSNSITRFLWRTWMGFTKRLAASNLASTWSTKLLATDIRQLTSPRTSCSACTPCPTTLSSRRRCWSTPGPLLWRSSEAPLVFFSASPSCPCGTESMWSGKVVQDS